MISFGLATMNLVPEFIIIFPEGYELCKDMESGKLEMDCLIILRSAPVKSTGNLLKKQRNPFGSNCHAV